MAEIQPLSKQFAIINPDGTPNDYFIRWAQQRQLDIQGGLTPAQVQDLIDAGFAAHTITAGFGLDGGGALSTNPTIDLDASLDDLNDVDLSTPPADQQVLGWDDGSSSWIAMDQSGGGGGGGGFVAPTIIRTATGRSATSGGTASVTLSAAPTVGNVMVMVVTGFNTTHTVSPGTWIPVASFSNVTNQVARVFVRHVQVGDGAAYTVAGSDYKQAVLIEMDELDGFFASGYSLANTSGSGWTTSMFMPWSGSAACVLALEGDGDSTYGYTSGPATPDLTYATNAAGNHDGIFMMWNSYPGSSAIAGTCSTTQSLQAMNVFFGKNGSSGGGGDADMSQISTYATSNPNGLASHYFSRWFTAGTVVTGAGAVPAATTTFNAGVALYGPVTGGPVATSGVALLASSAIASASSTSGQPLKIPFTTPYTIPTDGWYYVAYYHGANVNHYVRSSAFAWYNTSSIASWPATTPGSSGSSSGACTPFPY